MCSSMWAIRVQFRVHCRSLSEAGPSLAIQKRQKHGLIRVWEYTGGAHHIGILLLRWPRQCSSQSSPPSDYLKQRKQYCTEADAGWGRLLTCSPGDELSATTSVNVVGSVPFPFRQLTSTHRTGSIDRLFAIGLLKGLVISFEGNFHGRSGVRLILTLRSSLMWFLHGFPRRKTTWGSVEVILER
jgi:hypothetical protein